MAISFDDVHEHALAGAQPSRLIVAVPDSVSPTHFRQRLLRTRQHGADDIAGKTDAGDLRVTNHQTPVVSLRRVRISLHKFVKDTETAQDAPISVAITGDNASVRIDASNRGAASGDATLAGIFDPLMRGLHRQSEDGRTDSLGLGLYIASEIAKTHHGAIETRSNDSETTFSVSLPRKQKSGNV